MAISHLSTEVKDTVLQLRADLRSQGVRECLPIINEQLNLSLTKDDLYEICKRQNVGIRQDQLLDKKIYKLHQQIQNKDYWVEGFKDFLKGIKFPEVKEQKYRLYTHKGEIIVYVSDIHWGNGNTKEIDADFASITQWILAQNMNVHVIFGGDLGESFIPGGMHPGQEIKQDIKGFDLWLHIANKIYEMGEKLSDRVITMYGIGGNHGRLSKDTFGDLERTAELMIYELARVRLEKIGVEFKYFREKTNTFQIGKLHFILNHGDIGFDKLDIERLGWEYGKKGQYNIILHGDKHTGRFKMAEGICLVSCPALAGDGDYNKTLSLYSDKGFVSIIPYGDKAQISFNII